MKCIRNVTGATSLALLAAFTASQPTAAQQPKPESLPPVTVEQADQPPAAKPAPAATAPANKQLTAAKNPPAKKLKKAAAPQVAPAEPAAAAAAVDAASVVPAQGAGGTSLTVPTTAQAERIIQQTPGGVAVVPDTAYKSSTPAVTLKDALDYVPGVFIQPKWGEDSRLSIRGSGLSRNFHLRGTQLFMDGIPINTADGFGDFQEIDPTAYRYIEVYKGANALRYGANSLGGAINFVMPTGYDAPAAMARADLGSFGFHKLAASTAGVYGAADYFITGTWQEQDGFRVHSFGESMRGSANVGYRLSEDLETRFYLNANWVRQRIPGTVTKATALSAPETAAAINVINDWQRNIDTVRLANRTTMRVAPGTIVEIGTFGVDRHLMHPIFRWLDYKYNDYGGYARLVDESTIAGHANRFTLGATLHNGRVDAQQFAIGPGAAKLALLSRNDDQSENYSVYGENAFDLVPGVALIAGGQFLHAVRDRDVLFSVVGDQPGRQVFSPFSPKFGVLWDVDPDWQVFANISKSVEVPSFGENTVAGTPFQAKLQEAWTYEIGTRGRRSNYTWDIALYRAEIDNELQCLTLTVPFFNACAVTNADSTVHQGVELGFGVALLQSLFVYGSDPDKLWLNTAYTYNDFKFDGDAVWRDNELPGAPHHFIRAELLYKHPSGLFAGPNVEWVPEAYFIDNANTLKTQGYAIWGAKIGYDTGAVSAYIEGRNLSDEAYISSANVAGNVNGTDGAFFEPGNGRAVYGGVQYRW